MKPWIALGSLWLVGTAALAVDGRYEDAGLALGLLAGCSAAIRLERRALMPPVVIERARSHAA